jgi:hypothetical protein
MPSTEFRNRYPNLDKPTVVTVNGRPIGTWTPAPGTWGALVEPPSEPMKLGRPIFTPETDAIQAVALSRAFTPGPKPTRRK